MLAEGFGKRGKDDTLDEVLAAPDREELLFWLRHQPLMHLEDGYALVHAGLLPQWSAVQARALAREVETALQGENFRDCLAHLWGSEPNAWDDGLTGWERLRVVVNAMASASKLWIAPLFGTISSMRSWVLKAIAVARSTMYDA